jgi:RHS repeat-associated protein
VRDALGRITEKVETVDGASHTYEYAYDLAGRLIEVKTDGVVTGAYGYDGNGNRTSATVHGSTTSATYDAQDRLTAYGGIAFTYDANGALATRVENGLTPTYSYDVLGNLRHVGLPNGHAIDYVIDGANRRVGKRVDGTLVQAFLYANALKPIAELDGNGNVVARFVYGSNPLVPDYVIKGGTVYRVISDHLGSPRVVLDATTGAVAQRMDFDEWGKTVRDSNPGFQPFGFAGGIYDADTQLTRFGRRDYDARLGRWSLKDPSGFRGGPNVYAYCHGDPVNYLDRTGRASVAVILVSSGASFSLLPYLGYAAGGAAIVGVYAVVGQQLALLMNETNTRTVFASAPDAPDAKPDESEGENEWEEYDEDPKTCGGKHKPRRQKGNTPRNNQEQNKSFDDAVKEIERELGRELNPREVEQLHDVITGQGLGFWEIVEQGLQWFSK